MKSLQTTAVGRDISYSCHFGKPLACSTAAGVPFSATHRTLLWTKRIAFYPCSLLKGGGYDHVLSGNINFGFFTMPATTTKSWGFGVY